ncbi:SPX domain-domain-containing protein [Absidia repens]|uniref:SPX domain-domain-containing protein n=1 Tax=Absidia repens TaxID=90262 RepID=A0A1X2IT01_9FUNG|nr:SPX domain-domain-containing protein [Absidia repens]
MKFGKALLNNQLTEWSKNYLSYKALKKSINEASHTLPPSAETTTAIFFQLDREVEKVNTFYSYKQAQIDRRLWILSEKYQQHQDVNVQQAALEDDKTSTSGSSCTDITDELASALQETRAQLNKLMRFGELNAKGFRKILKKLDKKLGLETQTVYWETKASSLKNEEYTIYLKQNLCILTTFLFLFRFRFFLSQIMDLCEVKWTSWLNGSRHCRLSTLMEMARLHRIWNQLTNSTLLLNSLYPPRSVAIIFSRTLRTNNLQMPLMMTIQRSWKAFSNLLVLWEYLQLMT